MTAQNTPQLAGYVQADLFLNSDRWDVVGQPLSMPGTDDPPTVLWSEWSVEDRWLWLTAGDVDHTETAEVAASEGLLSLPVTPGQPEPPLPVPLWACTGFVLTADRTGPDLRYPSQAAYVASHAGRFIFPADGLLERDMVVTGTAFELRDGSAIYLDDPRLLSGVAVDGFGSNRHHLTWAGADDVVVQPFPDARPQAWAWRDLGPIDRVRSRSGYSGVGGSAWELVPAPDGPGMWPVEEMRIVRTRHRRHSVAERFGHALPLRADWFSGVLRIGRGPSKPAAPGSRDFVWQEERLVEVRSGRVLKVRRR